MESNAINHEGKVVKVTDTKVYAEIMVSEACGQCQARSMCFSKGKAITVETEREGSENFATGDEVNVYFTPKMANTSVIIAYVLPLVIFLALMFSISGFTGNEDLGAGIALLSLPIYYTILYFNRDKLKKKFIFKVEKKADFI